MFHTQITHAITFHTQGLPRVQPGPGHPLQSLTFYVIFTLTSHTFWIVTLRDYREYILDQATHIQHLQEQVLLMQQSQGNSAQEAQSKVCVPKCVYCVLSLLHVPGTLAHAAGPGQVCQRHRCRPQPVMPCFACLAKQVRATWN